MKLGKLSRNQAQSPKLNEVTVRIMGKDKTNYVKTFMLDTTNKHTFEYKGICYNIPADLGSHYLPGFWDWDKKLARFFAVHKTLASLFDWFNLADKANVELGYLYEEGNPDPIDLSAYVADIDWAKENYNLEHNESVAGVFLDVDRKLRGKQDSFSAIPWVLLAIIIIGVAVFVVYYFTGGHASPTVVQNVTAPVTASPTPFVPPFGGR